MSGLPMLGSAAPTGGAPTGAQLSMSETYALPGRAQERSLRVLVVTMWFPAPRETFAANDFLALVRAGVEVTIHALRAAHPKAEQFRAEYGVAGIESSSATWAGRFRGLWVAFRHPHLALAALWFIFSQNWTSLTHMAKSLALLPRTLELFGRIEAERPDVVHLFWGHYPALLGYLVKVRLGIRVTIFLGAYDLLTGYAGSVALAQRCDGIFTHAHANVPALLAAGLPAEKIHVVYRGVHPALLDAPAVPKQVRRVVTAGAFDPLKRMDGVLETFARIQKRWPDAELLVFGDGPLRRGLEAQARALRLQRVEFRGFVPQRDLFAEMQRAEVFLFLSCAERLANAIKEAIAARCYCVVGRTVGVEELIPGPDHGRIVADGAWDEAAEYVSQAFADPARRVETTERAIAHLRMHFDVNASMAQYRAVWSAFQA